MIFARSATTAPARRRGRRIATTSNSTRSTRRQSSNRGRLNSKFSKRLRAACSVKPNSSDATNDSAPGSFRVFHRRLPARARWQFHSAGQAKKLFDFDDQRSGARGLRLQNFRRAVAKYHRLADLPEIQRVLVANRVAIAFRDFRLPVAHIEDV